MSAGEVIMKNELCFVSQIASRDTSAESVHNIIVKFERWVSLKLMQLFTFYQRKTKNSRFDAPKKYHTSVRDEFTLINFIATCGCFIQWKCVYIYFTATDVLEQLMTLWCLMDIFPFDLAHYVSLVGACIVAHCSSVSRVARFAAEVNGLATHLSHCAPSNLIEISSAFD